MTDYATTMASNTGMPEDKQKQVGQAKAGDMDKEHKDFLKHVIRLLDAKEVDPYTPETLLKKDVYDALDTQWKGKTDLALPNIAHQLLLIEQFYRSKQTPNASVELATMIEHLWQMKQRIEVQHDVFKL